jgi:hypothetical protein
VETQRCHAVDTTLIPSSSKIHMMNDVQRDVDCLNSCVAYVQHITCPVRCVHKIDRAKRCSRRSDKLGRLLVRSTDYLENRAIGNLDPPMNQVFLGVTDKDVTVELCGIFAAPVNCNACTCIDDTMTGTSRFSRPYPVCDSLA